MIGGSKVVTFISAQGILIVKLLGEDTMVETTNEILQTAKTKHETIILPIDAIFSRPTCSRMIAIRLIWLSVAAVLTTAG